jgi:septum formation protein
MILASVSARRKYLLQSIGIDFNVIPADVTESHHGYYKTVAIKNAVAKAKAVAELHQNELVLGADTVIELNGDVIGKPANIEDAAVILKKLSGKQHNVVTAICLIRRDENVQCIFTESSKVYFRHIDDIVITEYLNKVHVLDKAGAYAIQEHGDILIDKIEGHLDNIIGLPTAKLKVALTACGLY